MFKEILNLEGASEIQKKEQRVISGGNLREGGISTGCMSTCGNCSGTCVAFNCSPSTATQVPGYVCITIGMQ